MTTPEQQPMSDDIERVHVMPIGDYREHESSRKCWCSPTPDDEDPRIWIHHSMDRREEYEQGRKFS